MKSFPFQAKTIKKPGVARRYVRTWLVVPACLVVLAGCKDDSQKATLGYKQVQQASAGKTTSTPVVKPAILTVESVEQNESLRLTGTLAADEQSQVASSASGIVQEVAVDRGSVVGKGDLLVKIDPRDAENRLAEGVAAVKELLVRLALKSPEEAFDPANQPEVKLARSARTLAEASFNRASELYKKKLISPDEMDRARTEYESAKQRYEQAVFQASQLYQSYETARVRLRALQKAVEDTSVTAPFDGLIEEKHVSPGETVSSMGGVPAGAGGPQVVTLVKINPLRLLITVPGRYIPQVTHGQKLEFEVDSFPGKKFSAEITRVAPSLQNNTRSLTVEAMVPNDDKQLRPGMFVTAELSLPARKSAVYVPAGVVRRDGESAYVFVSEDGIARERVVTTGVQEANRLEVTSGLKPGDMIVSATNGISDGMRIE